MPLRQEDLVVISSILYKQKEDELILREAVHLNTSYPPYSTEVGYEHFTKKGSAQILAFGASAKDIPRVGEIGGRVTKPVYKIATSIAFEESEIDAYQSRAALGQGPAVSLDTIRIETARRLIAEEEQRIFFTGDAKYKIRGMFNHDGIVTGEVSKTGTGGSTKWENKTPLQKLADLHAAKAAVEKDGLFKAKVLVLSPSAYLGLLKPYSEMATMTVLKWLESEGVFFDKIIPTRAVQKEYTGLGEDLICAFDNNPEVVELSLIEDIKLGQPVYDLLGNSEMAVTEKTAGIILRHPKGVYVGTGV